MNISAMQGSLCTNCIRIHWIMYTEFAFIVYWVLTMTSNDLSMTFDCKFLKTLNLSHSMIISFKSHQHPLNYEKSNILIIFQQWSQLTPRWPLTQLHEHPYCTFIQTSLHPSYINIHSIIRIQFAFIAYRLFSYCIDYWRSGRPGWAHSQRRVGVNITIPLHWPSCEWSLTLPIFLVCVRYQQ